MHFDKRSLLVCFVSESDETVSPRNACNRVKHDFGAFTAKEGADEFGFAVVP